MNLVNERTTAASSLMLQSSAEGEAGDLFGALIHRHINASSSLYSSMDMCLTMPLLEEPRDIFCCEEERSEGNVNSSSVEFSESDDCCVIQAESDDEPINREPIVSNTTHNKVNMSYDLVSAQRKYLSLSTKEEFFCALYNRNYLIGTKSRLLWPEQICAILCLRAVAGNDSAIFDIKMGGVPDIFIVGYTTKAVRHYLNHFYCIYAIRKILEKAKNSFSEATNLANNDPASLALGSILEDILSVCDASVGELENKFKSTFADASQCRGNFGCLVTVMKFSQHPFEILKHLFYMIAPSNISTCNETGKNFEFNGGNITSAQIDFYFKRFHWKKTTHPKQDSYPTGWCLLSHLFSKLESTRAFYSQLLSRDISFLRRSQHPVKMRDGNDLRRGITGASNLAKEYSSDFEFSKASLDYIRLCIASLLVRRVSIPLMNALDCAVFKLYDDCSKGSVQSNGDDITHISFIPPYVSSDYHCPLENIQLLFHWASVRIKQAHLQGVAIADVLNQCAAIRSGDTATEEGPNHLGLVLPLHPMDSATNSKLNHMSSEKIKTLVVEVNYFTKSFCFLRGLCC